MNGFLTVLLLLFPLSTWAQSSPAQMGGRATGIAYATSTLADEWALFNNPAGLAQLEQPTAAFTYERNPALEGFNRLATAMTIPVKPGTMALGVFRFGDQLFSEQFISAGFANKLGIASMGAKVSYVQYRIEGFGVKNVWSVAAGGIANLTEQISVGAMITNVNQPTLPATDEKIPAHLSAGVALRPVSHLHLFAEVEKRIDKEATLRGAFEYAIHKKIFFRTGFNLYPNAAFFGIGYQTKKVKIDYGIKYVQTLRFAHQASASYHLQSKTKKGK